MGDRLMNEGLKWLILIVFFAINIALFINSFIPLAFGDQYFYLRKMVGLALCFARASAAPLNFNCMLILLPVCRNLISFMRSYLCRFCKRNVRRQLDKSITFHKLIAYAICFWSVIHYFAHTFNFERFLGAWDSKTNDSGLLSTLSLLPTTPNGTRLNPIRTAETNPMLELVKNPAGITGVLITLPLIIIIASATEVIRRSYFEVFWFTHHLFIVFYIALVTHGLGYVVRAQTNLAAHDVTYCSPRYMQWGADPLCPVPQFASGGPQSWKWVLAPVIIYLIERIIRLVRSCQTVEITKVVTHPSRVFEIQMRKAGWKMEAGQYIFVQCPSISQLEWHPFTLTSAPDDDHFSIHVRLAGDWTQALAKALHCDQQEFHSTADLPALAVDGPFGTCSEDVFSYQVDMLVGAGIGATPFGSILKDIWYKSCNPDTQMKLRKVYFFWICPDTRAFEWFTDVLHHLEEKMAEAGRADFLSANIFLTRGWSFNQAINLTTREQEERDPITGLRQKTQYGRPNWDNIFSEIAQQHRGTRIGVFFCGPKVLSTQLHKMSNKYSSSDPKDTHFVYNKENF